MSDERGKDAPDGATSHRATGGKAAKDAPAAGRSASGRTVRSNPVRSTPAARNGAAPAESSRSAQSDPDAMEQALARFEEAIAALDRAADEALAKRFGSEGAQAEVHALMEDRRDLARRLDRTEARSRTLADANAEVSRRIVSVMDDIRSVMDG